MIFPIAFTVLGLYLVAGFFHIFFNQGFAFGVREYLVYWLGREDKKDKLLEEKVILSYIAQNGYCFTLAELMQIMNWSYNQVEQEAVWLLVNYGGEPIVEENGVILYDFSHLKDDTSTTKTISNEYQIYQINKKIEKLAYRERAIKVSEVDVFSFKSWDRQTYLQMKVYLMNYYLGAVLFCGTLVIGITIWRFSISDGDFSKAINGGRPMSSEEIANMQVLFIFFLTIFVLSLFLALVVLWRWFAVQIPAKKAKQVLVFKSILYEYIFETLPESNVVQMEMLLNELNNYRAGLPINIKSIKSEEVAKEVLTDFKAEPIAQEDGKVVYSLVQIAEELETIQLKRGR